VARIDKGLDVRAIEVGAHHTHPFAIAPVQLAVLLIELELFGRERAPLRNDGRAIPPVEVGAFNGAVVPAGDAHVGPVDVPAFDVHRDAVRKPAPGDKDLGARAVGIYRENASAAQIEHEQAAHGGLAGLGLCWKGLGSSHWLPPLKVRYFTGKRF
jgi:hypothetical protein